MLKPVEMREADFKRAIQNHTEYPEKMRQEFFDYWSEPSKTGKMRFELEKTWHLGRRLARWANNGFGSRGKESPVISPKMAIKAPVTEVEKLDDLLRRYRERFESVSLEEMAPWYDYLKSEKLMRQFKKEDIELIKVSYPGNNLKCRGACVKMTFDGYINTGLTFGHIMELRKKLA